MKRSIQLVVQSLLVAMVQGNTAWATSPYDLPYGLQWNFMIGNVVADTPSSCVASPDGTVWIATMGTGMTGTGNPLTWGNPNSIYSGHYASGYGQISPLGQIMQANDIPAIPDMASPKQAYAAGITMRGTTAYCAWYPNGDAYWANQAPPDVPSGQNPMTVSIASVATPQGTPYPNAAGLGHKFTMDLLSTGGRSHDSVVASDGSMYFVGANQAGDKFTVGDFNTNAVGYRPWVGKVAADGVTLSGPAKQPSGDSTRDYFNDVAVNEANGHVFAVGYSYQGSPTHWDPDGTGPIQPYPYSNAAGIGTGVIYDGGWNVVTSIVWDTDQAGEGIYDCSPAGDGGWIAVGQTTGNLKTGANNPAPGTRDIYVAKYDSAGALVWDYQSESAIWDYAGDVTVDPADGSVYVSGSRQRAGASDNDPILMKFTAAGALVWTTFTDNGGSDDDCVDHANVGKHKIYVFSRNNPTVGGIWTTTTGYIPRGDNENLLQKLGPGDFDDGTATGTSDGLVNFDDVQYAGTQAALGLADVDMYDFNEDGDSTLEDAHYMISNIMDRLVGDIHPGASSELRSDVDNADIGKAIGSYTGAGGSGKLYLEGDMNFDGDVDNDDIAFMTEAFSGALTPNGEWPPYGKPTTNGTGADLLYNPVDGHIWLSAEKSPGRTITSFQLENTRGTFVPTNYVGLSAGGFGGALENVTTNVIADTDLTFSGFRGARSFGKSFPADMSLEELKDYLTTAVYTGRPGSSQKQFNLVLGAVPPTPGTLLIVR